MQEKVEIITNHIVQFWTKYPKTDTVRCRAVVKYLVIRQLSGSVHESHQQPWSSGSSSAQHVKLSWICQILHLMRSLSVLLCLVSNV